tara:strand:- start:260 stop:691 length:432 start_codon:yes stop_codon:yes gene_type:complete
MKNFLLLERAIKLAVKAHKGQVDRFGQPYILHPLRMMLMVEGNLEKIVALLHDTVEKTATTYDDLRNKGFSGDVIEAVNSLTRRKEEGYDKYISRVSKNNIAVAVKISDLNDHITESKKRGMTKKNKDRIKKYEIAKQKLLKE